MRPADDQDPNLELPPQDDRPDGQQNVMKSDGKGRGELAATEYPGDQHGDQRLEAEKRGKPEDEADGDAPGDGVRGVANLRKALLALAKLEGEEVAKAAH